MLDLQKILGKPQIQVTEISDSQSNFVVKNLPRGFGHTLGNALRRLILSYNLGAAVTAINIKGVSHEYHVIEGVKESVLQMMLNFKKLRFDVDENLDTITTVTRKTKGSQQRKASDIKLPTGISVLNPDEYLFETTDPSLELIIDVRIEKGYFYYSIEHLRAREKKSEEGTKVGTLLIDNDFAAVEHVTYSVTEEIEDFSGTTKDALTLEIKTRFPTVNPKKMLMFAGEALTHYAKMFAFDEFFVDKTFFVDPADLNVETEIPTSENGEVAMNAENANKTMPIDALPLSERTRNALIKNGILYVDDLEQKKKAELLLLKGLGKKAIDEIAMALASIDKTLAG